jgi:hypothetical protein
VNDYTVSYHTVIRDIDVVRAVRLAEWRRAEAPAGVAVSVVCEKGCFVIPVFIFRVGDRVRISPSKQSPNRNYRAEMGLGEVRKITDSRSSRPVCVLWEGEKRNRSHKPENLILVERPGLESLIS